MMKVHREIGPGLARIFPTRAKGVEVAQTSKSAVSQVSKPARLPVANRADNTLRIWKSATRQVGTPALQALWQTPTPEWEICGLDEAIYQSACEEEFSKQGMNFEPQASRWIMHRDQRVKELIPDFLIEDKFILDLKAIFGELPKAAYAQVLCYCKLFEVRLGMLGNFGNQSLDWKRRAYDSEPGNLDLDSTLSDLNLPKTHQAACKTAVMAGSAVWELHGPGYTDDIYKLLLQAELTHQKVEFATDPAGEISGRTISKLPLILVDGLCPVYLIALHEKPTATHLARMRTYLNCLNLPCGYLINFGRKSAQIIGVKFQKK